jgi:hypothetical protein
MIDSAWMWVSWLFENQGASKEKEGKIRRMQSN